MLTGDSLNAGLLSLLLCLHEALAPQPFAAAAPAAPAAAAAAAAAASKWDIIHGLLNEGLGLLTAALQQKRLPKP